MLVVLQLSVCSICIKTPWPLNLVSRHCNGEVLYQSTTEIVQTELPNNNDVVVTVSWCYWGCNRCWSPLDFFLRVVSVWFINPIVPLRYRIPKANNGIRKIIHIFIHLDVIITILIVIFVRPNTGDTVFLLPMQAINMKQLVVQGTT